MTATVCAEKRPFRILHRDGRNARVARIPTSLSVADALPELSRSAGFPAEPGISTRYSLLAAPGATDDFVLLPDDALFADVAADSHLRIAAQPRPASRAPR